MNEDDTPPSLTPTRRAVLATVGASLLSPSAALGADSEICDPPRYLKWIGRRERKWRDELGPGGFVNYYGEKFHYDDALFVSPETYPACNVYGAVSSTLADKGKVRDNVGRLSIAGKATTTNCHAWPGEAAEDYERRVADLVNQLRQHAPKPTDGSLRFTAVGSRHSSSDVYKRTEGGRAMVLHIEGLNHVLYDRPEFDPAFIEAQPDMAFAMVGAGITVCQLNETLWSAGLAIETQGSFDGQTLAGAISTGTHGAGEREGSVGDSAQAVILITWVVDPDTSAGRWEVLQVEPGAPDAITLPSQFRTERAGVPWRLVQDDALFDAAVMTMGTMGIIVGYVMRVRPAYFLHELRVGRPWSEVRQNLADRAIYPPNGFSGRGWRYEVAVNPNAIRGISDWATTEVYRDEWPYDLDYLSEQREIPQKWLGGVARNVNLGGNLGNTIAEQSSKALVRGQRLGSFADRCYSVLKLGQGEYVQAWGNELMVPAELGAKMVDWVLTKNPTVGALKRGLRRNERLMNPFGVRFSRGKRGFLTPVRWYKDGKPGLVCTCELTEAVKDNDGRNIGERANGKPSSKQVVAWWAEQFIAEFGTDGRVHWGQVQGNYGPEQLAQGYDKADIDAWYDAFRTLNPLGMFDTTFATRLGFVDRRNADKARAPRRYKGLGLPLTQQRPLEVRTERPVDPQPEVEMRPQSAPELPDTPEGPRTQDETP